MRPASLAPKSLAVALCCAFLICPTSIGCSRDEEKSEPVAAAGKDSPEPQRKKPVAKASPGDRQDKSGKSGKEPADPEGKVGEDSKPRGPADTAPRPEVRIDPQSRTQPVPAPPPVPDQVPAQAQARTPPADAATHDPATAAASAVKADPSRPALPDPRLLLTLADISSIAPAKARFQRAPLPGVPRTEDSDSILYKPEKGEAFGFALQIFRGRNALETKKRYDALQASYPSAQEITSVSGKTFFSYWDETMHIGFVHPSRNLNVIVSCGQKFCDSDKLMVLSQKVAERLR